MTSTLHLPEKNNSANDSIIEKTWPKKLKDLFKPISNKFLFKGIDIYNIDSSYIGAVGLTNIDTFLLKKIHQFRKISKKSTYIFDQDINTYYYYSMDRPINHFFPIVLIKRGKMGVVFIEMILFEEKGNIKNIVQIGGRGEIGRGFVGGPIKVNDALNNAKMSNLIYSNTYSSRVNDSTLVMVTKNPDYETISDVNTWVSNYEESEIIIHRNAKLEVKNIKTYRK